MPHLHLWMKQLLAGLFALYVVELVLRNMGLPVVEAVWRSFGAGFHWWQPLTRYLVQGDAVTGVLFGLLLLYFLLPALEQLVSHDTLKRAFVAGAAGGTVIPMLLDAVGVLPAGGLMGWTALASTTFLLFGLAMPSGVIYLMFVLPVSGQMIVYGSLALSVLFFLLSPTLGSAEPIGVWCGVVGWWYSVGPGGRRRALKSKAKNIEEELKRFRVIEGGRSQPPPDDWIH